MGLFDNIQMVEQDPEVCGGCGERHDSPPGEHCIVNGLCDNTHAPQHTLTDEQREQIAEFEKLYDK